MFLQRFGGARNSIYAGGASGRKAVVLRLCQACISLVICRAGIRHIDAGIKISSDCWWEGMAVGLVTYCYETYRFQGWRWHRRITGLKSDRFYRTGSGPLEHHWSALAPLVRWIPTYLYGGGGGAVVARNIEAKGGIMIPHNAIAAASRNTCTHYGGSGRGR